MGGGFAEPAAWSPRVSNNASASAQITYTKNDLDGSRSMCSRREQISGEIQVKVPFWRLTIGPSQLSVGVAGDRRRSPVEQFFQRKRLANGLGKTRG
jgi:hypothetical protein